MINEKLPYSFNQFETALVAFFSDFRKRINFIVPNAPVYFQNTGDFSYFIGMKFHRVRTSDMYQKTPRVVVKLDDIQVNQSEDTMFINQMDYVFDGTEYTCTVRRRTYAVALQIYFVSPSVVSMLNHAEVMATFGARPNVFTYEFLGNTIDGQYTIQSNSTEFPTIDAGSQGSRDVTYTTTVELQVPLWIPKIETIKNLHDSKSSRVIFDLQMMHKDLVEYETNLEIAEAKEKPNPSVGDSYPNRRPVDDTLLVAEMFGDSTGIKPNPLTGAIDGTALAKRIQHESEKNDD